MDFGRYVPDDLPQFNRSRHSRQDEGRQLKERIQNHAIEIHQLGNELFQKLLYKRKLEANIKALHANLLQLAKSLKVKIQNQNNVAQLVNAEVAKQRVLQKQARAAMERVEESNRKMAMNRRRCDGFGAYAVKFHDTIDTITCEITGMEEEMRRYREKEGELVKLNVDLANAETELRETINSIKVTEVQLAKYDTRNRKYLKDMEVLADKQAELEASLMAHEAEKLRLQKELEGFSIETKLNDKLDEIDVAMERHTSVMCEVQAKHDEAMRTLQEEMRVAVEKNEAFQKLLTELDGTLAEQHEALDRAKEELAKVNTSGGGSSDVVDNDDPEVRALQLELEFVQCEYNQVEEEVMHAEDQLADAEITRSLEGEEEEEEQQEKAKVIEEKSVNDVTADMTTNRTSTPKRRDTLDSLDLDISLTSATGLSLLSRTLAEQRSQLQGISFRSTVSPAMTQPARRHTHHRMTRPSLLELEVSSSTQNY